MAPGGRALDHRRNSLNAMRLILAGLVLVSHAWPLSGAGAGPSVHGTTLGTCAVWGFFAISGYLITRSRLRLPTGRFLWHRVLRIFPGLWLALLLVALVAVLAGASVRAAIGYVAQNGLLVGYQPVIGHTLGGVPFPSAWNGSLWTLPYEFVCYVAVAVAGAIGVLRRAPAVLIASSLAAVVVLVGLPPTVWMAHVNSALVLGVWLPLALPFLAGVVFAVYDVPLRVDVAVGAAVVLAAGLVAWPSDRAIAVVAAPLAYLMLWLGAALPFAGWCRNDLSYGVYVFAFPVEQMLAAAGIRSPWLMIPLAMTGTLPLAAFSWFFVERRALRLKDIQQFTSAASSGLQPGGVLSQPVTEGAASSGR